MVQQDKAIKLYQSRRITGIYNIHITVCFIKSIAVQKAKNNIKADVDLNGKKFKKLMNYADKIKVEKIIIIGEKDLTFLPFDCLFFNKYEDCCLLDSLDIVSATFRLSADSSVDSVSSDAVNFVRTDSMNSPASLLDLAAAPFSIYS